MNREIAPVRSLINAFLFVMIAILCLLSTAARAQEDVPVPLPGGVMSGRATSLVPEQPMPYSPFNGDISNNLKPTLRWETSTGATKYNVSLKDVDTSVEQTGIVLAADCTSACAYKPGEKLLDGHTYTWRVEAVNGSGKTASDQFTITIDFPGAPTLLTPLHDDKVHSAAITFEWTKIKKAQKYVLVIEDLKDNSIALKKGIDAAICGGSCVYTLNESSQVAITNGHDYRWTITAKHKKGESVSGNYDFKARFK